MSARKTCLQMVSGLMNLRLCVQEEDIIGDDEITTMFRFKRVVMKFQELEFV
jgi:hypothetical protein